MSSKLPPTPLMLKGLVPYLQRADEFDKHDPVTAYYCRFYAAQNALKDPEASKDKQCRAFLIALMDKLEADKRSLSNLEAIRNDVVAAAHLEDFALKLFDFSDNEDREGRANKKVARSFYAASIVFDVLKSFGEMDTEIAEKHKYAKFKAVYITKCLKNGEVPIPGPPTGEDAVGGDDADFGQQSQPPPAQSQQFYDSSSTPPSYGADGGAPQQQPSFGGARPPGAFPVLPLTDVPSSPAGPAYPPRGASLGDVPVPPVNNPYGSISNFNSAPGGGNMYNPAMGMGNGPAAGGYPGPPSQQQHQQPPLPPSYPPNPSHFPSVPGAGGKGPTSGNSAPQQPPAAPTPAAPRPMAHVPNAPSPAPANIPSAAAQGMNALGNLQPRPSISLDDFAMAAKHAKFAISALQYEDVTTAITNLQNALALISVARR